MFLGSDFIDSVDMQTSVCRGFNALEFSAFMSQPSDRFSVNLANATLVEVIDAYVKHRALTRPRFERQWFTTRKYVRGLEFLCGQKIMPEQISELFYPYLIKFMLEQGCATSTVEHTCSQIRSALEWGSRYGAQISPSYDKVDFSGETHEKTILSYAELCHVYYYDIDGIKGRRADWKATMKKVRDMFVFSVVFGQRHSDAVRIDRTCFDDTRFTITQQKTGNKVSYDWTEYAFNKKIAQELLQRYDYCAPYTADISVYNKKLKDLFRAIGMEFDAEIKNEEKVLGEIVTTVQPRWKMIGSHTARRTAISYWANMGKNMNWIRRFSGHRDLRSLQEYMLEEG